MRIHDWANRFNIRARRNEERPDNPSGDVVYRLKDLFTTRDGSWEPSDKPGTLPQWARETYLRPLSAPDFFDDAGGDHHLFARVLDINGRPVVERDLVLYWSDGFHQLGNPSFQNYIRMTPKERSGWANQVVFNSFNPDRGERGAWCWCPRGAADVVEGGGLPNNQHVSFFAVWQAEPRAAGTGITASSGTTSTPASTATTTSSTPAAAISLEEIRRQTWVQAGQPSAQDSPLAAYARRNNLGAPQTAAFDAGGYRIQGFANGIVYASIGQWNQIQHVSW